MRLSPISVAAEADRVAERAVERRSVFGRIGHDLHVAKAGRIEAGADGANSAVHHVGGRDDVAARFGLDHGLAHQNRDRFVVENDSLTQQPIMAVAGIGVERHVAEHADLRHLFLDRSDGAADEVFGVKRLGAAIVAPAGLGIGK